LASYLSACFHVRWHRREERSKLLGWSADVLNGMQTFAEGWFERRHAGTKAALEACESMCAAKMPTEWFSTYQKWLMGAVERLVADGLACESEIRKLSEVLAPSLVPSTDHEHRNVQEVAKKRTRAQVA
jgi:hypothetical protein